VFDRNPRVLMKSPGGKLGEQNLARPRNLQNGPAGRAKKEGRPQMRR
jgi:hypothetical protein